MSGREPRRPRLGDLDDVAEAEVLPEEGIRAPRPRAGRLARSTAFFAVATAFSRVAGLVREIFAASYFGIGPSMSAFTIAFLVPNTVRSLFADAAIQAAFVPVFTEELEHGRRREAFRLASTLIFVVAVVLGLITAFFILAAPVIMPVFAPGFEGATLDLTVSLSRLLFPILVLLGISGMVVGVLNSYDRFSVFAIAPFFWNVAIIAVLVGLAPAFPADDQIYAYAIGVLVGTVIQLAMLTFDLRRTPFGIRRALVDPFRIGFRKAFGDADVRRVLLLMLPVTLSLGLININLLVNSFFGTLVSDEAPAAIDKAFRIYMLPQGIFSVAVSTVLFPTLARYAARGALDDLRATMANGMRQIILLLTPAAAAILVLSEPMIRLVYQRGEFGAAQTDLVATALFWFAFSLPFNGLFLLLTRTFFSLQRPWVPTAISAVNLAITALVLATALRPVRGRRHRRRDGDCDGGQRRRPGGGAAPRARQARARALRVDGDQGRGRIRGPRRGELRSLGRPRSGSRTRARRSDRLARRRPARRGGRLRRRGLRDADPRDAPDQEPGADRPPLTRGVPAGEAAAAPANVKLCELGHTTVARGAGEG